MNPYLMTVRRRLQELEQSVHLFLLFDSLIYFRNLLANFVSNLFQEDPSWLTFIGAPSSGRTTMLNLLRLMPNCHFVENLSPASFLPGSSGSGRDSRKPGLLDLVGKFGYLIIPDFTVILNLPSAQLMQILAILRNVYDGRYSRALGTGTETIRDWEGKAVLLSCATQEYDKCHSVNSTMGDRSLLSRMSSNDDVRNKQANMAITRCSNPGETRTRLAHEVKSFLESIEIPLNSPIPELPPRMSEGIAALAQVVADCRSAVDRDHSGEVMRVPHKEGPSRIGIQLRLLLHGHLAIGLTLQEAWEAIKHVAFSSMPEIRRDFFQTVFRRGPISIDAVAGLFRLGRSSVRRTMLELKALGVITSSKDRQADVYVLSDFATHLMRLVEAPVSEASEQPKDKVPIHLLCPPASENVLPALRAGELLPEIALGHGESVALQFFPAQKVVLQLATRTEGNFPEKSHDLHPHEGDSAEESPSDPPKRERRAASFSNTGHTYPGPDHLNGRPLLAGMVFGSWTALEADPGKPRGKVRCRCICGKERWVRLDNLYSGMSKSCGCGSRIRRKGKAQSQPSMESVVLSDAATEVHVPTEHSAAHASAACMA